MQDNPLKLKLFLQGEFVPSFERAACYAENIDPEFWFVDDAESAKIAKGYCTLCPYGPNPTYGDDSCFDYFIQVEEQDGYFAYGILGGRDASDRQRMLDLKKLKAQIEAEESGADAGCGAGGPQAEAE